MTWKLYEADCFDILPSIEDKSVDMVLCDLPYGTTACKWDTPLPLDKLWEEYKRVIKDNGAIVLTRSQPFTTRLISSNYEMFRYAWVWDKNKGANFLNANKMPLKSHEDVLVFGKKQPRYYPQMIKGKLRNKKYYHKNDKDNIFNCDLNSFDNWNDLYFPKSVLLFSDPVQNKSHPTQKPVGLFEYLIKTYTNEGDLVLDNCAGSGTTRVARQNLQRDCILIEKEPEYCQIIRERMDSVESLIVEARKQQTLTDFIPAK